MRSTGSVHDIIRPGAIYGAAIWIAIAGSLVPHGERRASGAPWYIQLLALTAAFGIPLLRDLYVRQRWLLPLVGRVILGWMLAIPLGSPLLGLSPLIAYGPGHPVTSLLRVLMGCAILGAMSAALIALGIAAVRFGRTRCAI